MTTFEIILLIAFGAMTCAALWYKTQAERAEEWVYFIQSEIDRLIREDSEA